MKIINYAFDYLSPHLIFFCIISMHEYLFILTICVHVYNWFYFTYVCIEYSFLVSLFLVLRVLFLVLLLGDQMMEQEEGHLVCDLEYSTCYNLPVT